MCHKSLTSCYFRTRTWSAGTAGSSTTRWWRNLQPGSNPSASVNLLCSFHFSLWQHMPSGKVLYFMVLRREGIVFTTVCPSVYSLYSTAPKQHVLTSSQGIWSPLIGILFYGTGGMISHTGADLGGGEGARPPLTPNCVAQIVLAGVTLNVRNLARPPHENSGSAPALGSSDKTCIHMDGISIWRCNDRKSWWL